MAKSFTKYSIFLASTGELEEERIEIENVIKELNFSYGNSNNLILELIKWETHSAPGITDTYTQDLISKDLGDEYDIFIGLLWQNFGTKTKTANSGTEEEFLNALRRFKNNENIQILFYFKTTPPKSLEDLNLEQLGKVRQFKEKLKEEDVLYGTFDSLDDFKTKLRMHIPKRIESLRKQEVESTYSNTTKKDTGETIQNETDETILEEDYGLFDYAVSFESLLNESSIALNNITNSTTEVGDEINKNADEIVKISKQPNPNKFHMLEILKRVSKIMNNYSDRLKMETPIFYDNFKEAIDMGLKYMNLINEFDDENHQENMNTTLEASISLRDSLPHSIEGIKTMYKSVLSIPRLQADINSAKRKMESSIQDLIDKLENAYELTKEFVGEIELKLK